MDILLLILNAIFVTPFFTPIGFYTIYLNRNKRKVLENIDVLELYRFTEHLIMRTIILYIIMILQYTMCFVVEGPIQFAELLCIVPIYKIFSYYITYDTHLRYNKMNFSKKLKISNVVFNFLICIISIFISFYFTTV